MAFQETLATSSSAASTKSHKTKARPTKSSEDFDNELLDILHHHLKNPSIQSQNLALDLWNIFYSNLIKVPNKQQLLEDIKEIIFISPENPSILETLLPLTDNAPRCLFQLIANKIKALLETQEKNTLTKTASYFTMLLRSAEAIPDIKTSEKLTILDLTKEYLAFIFTAIISPFGKSRQDLIDLHPPLPPQCFGISATPITPIFYEEEISQVATLIDNVLQFVDSKKTTAEKWKPLFEYCLLTIHHLFKQAPPIKEKAQTLIEKLSLLPLSDEEVDALNKCLHNHLSADEYVCALPNHLDSLSHLKNFPRKEQISLLIARLQFLLASKCSTPIWKVCPELLKQVVLVGGCRNEQIEQITDLFLDVADKTCSRQIKRPPLSALKQLAAYPIINGLLFSRSFAAIDHIARLVIHHYSKNQMQLIKPGDEQLFLKLLKTLEVLTTENQELASTFNILTEIHPSWILSLLKDHQTTFSRNFLDRFTHTYLSTRLSHSPKQKNPTSQELESFLEIIELTNPDSIEYWNGYFQLIKLNANREVVISTWNMLMESSHRNSSFQDWLLEPNGNFITLLNKAKSLEPKDLIDLLMKLPSKFLGDFTSVPPINPETLEVFHFLFSKAAQIKSMYKTKLILCAISFRLDLLVSQKRPCRFTESDSKILQYCFTSQDIILLKYGSTLLNYFIKLSENATPLKELAQQCIRATTKIQNPTTQSSSTNSEEINLEPSVLLWISLDNLKKLRLSSNTTLEQLSAVHSTACHTASVHLLFQLSKEGKKKLSKKEAGYLLQVCSNLGIDASLDLLNKVFVLLNCCDTGNNISQWKFKILEKILITTRLKYQVHSEENEPAVYFTLELLSKNLPIDPNNQKKLFEQMFAICEAIVKPIGNLPFILLIYEIASTIPGTSRSKSKIIQTLTRYLLAACQGKKFDNPMWDVFSIYCERHLFNPGMGQKFQISLIKKLLRNQGEMCPFIGDFITQMQFCDAFKKNNLSASRVLKIVTLLSQDFTKIEYAFIIMEQFVKDKNYEMAFDLAERILQYAAPSNLSQFIIYENHFRTLFDHLKMKTKTLSKNAMSILSQLTILIAWEYIPSLTGAKRQLHLNNLLTTLKNSRSEFLQQYGEDLKMRMQMNTPADVIRYLSKLCDNPGSNEESDNLSNDKEISRFLQILYFTKNSQEPIVDFDDTNWKIAYNYLLLYFTKSLEKTLLYLETKNLIDVIVAFFHVLMHNHDRFETDPEEYYDKLHELLKNILIDYPMENLSIKEIMPKIIKLAERTKNQKEIIPILIRSMEKIFVEISNTPTIEAIITTGPCSSSTL